MALPNPGMDAVPFTPLTAEFLDDIIENIESLSSGTGIGDGSITAPKLDSASYYASLALADLNGWKRYVNPVNGKIRYYRSGTATGASGSAGGFQYVTTGINLPASTRIISATCGVRDQAVSATCVLNAGNVRFSAQTFFSPITPVIDWYWELEEI